MNRFAECRAQLKTIARSSVLHGLILLCVLAYLPSILSVCAGNYPFGGDAGDAGDAIAAFGPWHEFTRQCINEGVLPLWNPHHFCGQPFLGNGQTALLYPPNVIYWLPLPVAFLLDAMLHNLLLMCGAYVLARALGMTRLAAWCVAMAMGLSGSVSAHINDGHMTWHAVRAYLPWELWALLSYLRTGRRRYALSLTALFALQVAAGHPPMVLLSFGLCCGLFIAWTIARFLSQRQASESPHVLPVGWISTLVTTGLLTAALSAVNVLPLREISRLSVHGSGLTYKQAIFLSATWRSLTRLLFPGVFGGNTDEAWSIRFGSHEEAAYIGLLALILAIGAPWFAQRADASKPPRAVWWLWALLPVAALLALGNNTPVYHWLFDHVPLLRLVRLPVRWLEMFYLVAALLAGYGFDGWLSRTRAVQQEYSPHATSITDKRVIGLPVVLGVTAIVSLIAGVLCLLTPVQSTFWMTTAQWNARRPPAERLMVAAELQGTAMTGLLIAFVLALGGVMLTRKLLSATNSNANERRRNELAIVGLMSFDVLLCFWLSAKPYPHEVVQSLITWPQELTRYYEPGQRWSTQVAGGSVNAGLAHGIDLFNGYDPMSGRRYFEFVENIGERHWRENFQAERHPPLVRVAGVTHVLKYQFEKKREPVQEGTLQARSGQFELWKLSAAWPRFYLSRRVLRASEKQQTELLKRLSVTPFDLHNAPVVVAPGIFSDVTESSLKSTEHVLKWQRDTNSINLETEAVAPSVLVVSESWAPGWRAWVMGPDNKFKPVPLDIGNFLFRAVKVPVGHARVSMAYDSTTFRFGAFLTLCGLAGFTALTAIHFRRMRGIG